MALGDSGELPYGLVFSYLIEEQSDSIIALSGPLVAVLNEGMRSAQGNNRRMPRRSIGFLGRR
jgi:hypothetical protein